MVLEQNSQMNLAHSSQDLDNFSRTERSSRRSIWPSQGTRKGLLAAIGVGLVLMVLVISAVVFVNKNQTVETVVESDDSETKQRLVADRNVKVGAKNITLPDILSGVYGAKGFNGTWISGDEIQYFDPLGNVMLYNVTAGTSTLIISASKFNELQSKPFEVTLAPRKAPSNNLTYALIGYDSQKLYRHSFYARFAIYDFNTGLFENLVPAPGDQEPSNPNNLLQLVQWSPNGDAIAFVFENNVFYRSSPLPGTQSKKVTTSGSHQVYNGVTDWVYEEEMFSSFRALWFSPEGTHLAFATFDDTEVMQIQFPLYGNPGQFPNFQYPLLESIPYPKAGTTNPKASISIVNVGMLPKTGPVPPIGKLQLTDEISLSYYLGTTIWATDSELLVVTLNRHQNISTTLLCNADTKICPTINTVQQSNGWIDINTPVVIESGSEIEFLFVTSASEGNEHYRHIVKFDRKGTSSKVTSGKFSVDSISGWDKAKNRVYFMAPLINGTTVDPSDSHLYFVNLAGDKKTTCVTCDEYNVDKTSLCRSNGADLSKNSQYFVHSCNGPSVPEVVIRSLKDDEYRVAKNVWVDNVELKLKLQLVQLPIIQDYDIPVANGFTAKARLWLPPNYNKNQKYPILVDVYGGPGSQKISQRFTVDWGVSLVTSKEVIYASIDGRGSGRQSEDLMFQLYRKLGTVEIEDQIAAAKWLIANNVDNVIDANRTAIWGWSYGGYSTAMVMGTDLEGIYKCGISVAPVTSWVFYDTIYTERYMGLPTRGDNLDSYNFSDVTNHVSNFRTKKYYLIHGNADDNVHYQQSMLLSRALERADILFRQQSYPDENHGLGTVRRHLYHSLENFLFEECF